MIRCVIDCFVGLYLLKKTFSAKIAGILGVISTIMAIMQSLEKMWLIYMIGCFIFLIESGYLIDYISF